MAGRSVLVTGGTGFIGSHLLHRLIEGGARVGVLTRTDSHAREQFQGHATVLVADLMDARSVREVVGAFRPDVVFHLAAVVDLERSLAMAEQCVRVNLLGTLELLKALESSPLSAFVLASTTEVYGNGPLPFTEGQREAPPSPYAVSKLAAEQIIMTLHRAQGFPAIVARVATAYGPGQPRHRLIPTIIEAYSRGEPPQLSDPSQSRDFLFVDDVVEGLLACVTHPNARGEVINLGDDASYTVQHIADTIRDLMGVNVTARYGDRAPRPNEARVWSSSRKKAGELLDWAPRVGLREGLQQTIAGFHAHAGGV